jgi:hypothetical protein
LYNNNCDSTQRLSGNGYGEIQHGSKLDDQLTGTKNQVPILHTCLLMESSSMRLSRNHTFLSVISFA